VKSSSLLDYKYSRISGIGMNQNTLVHFWELGGGRRMTKLLDLILNPEHIADTLILVALDLSKPSKVFDNAMFWMQHIKARTTAILNQMKDSGSSIPAQLRQDALTGFGENHPDAASLDLSPVPLVIVPCKFESFKDQDPERLKIMARSIRLIAHSSGASVMYFTPSNKTIISALRARITRHIQQKQAASKAMMSEYTKPVLVTAGADSFQAIGEQANNTQKWGKVFEQAFPLNPQDDDEEKIDHLDLKAEASVDSMLAQKVEELKRLTRDAEFQRRMKQESIYGNKT
jgi:hypothetical protein